MSQNKWVSGKFLSLQWKLQTKATCRVKGLPPIAIYHKVGKGKNSRREPGSKGHGKCCLLPSSTAFLLHPEPPAQGCTTHRGVGPPISIVNQKKKVPKDLPTSQSDGDKFSSDIPSSGYVCICIELTETKLLLSKAAFSGVYSQQRAKQLTLEVWEL